MASLGNLIMGFPNQVGELYQQMQNQMAQQYGSFTYGTTTSVSTSNAVVQEYKPLQPKIETNLEWLDKRIEEMRVKL